MALNVCVPTQKYLNRIQASEVRLLRYVKGNYRKKVGNNIVEHQTISQQVDEPPGENVRRYIT